MKPAKMPSLMQDGTIVKIGVEYPGCDAQLIQFDQQQPLSTIIQNLCCSFNITDAENYALQFSQDPLHFVTEKTRKNLKHGQVLNLRHSPEKTTKDILFKLHSGSNNEKLDVLKELMVLSSDPTFAYEFINQKGNPVLIGAIENGQWNQDMLAHALPALVELLENGGVLYANLSDTFIARNVEFIKRAKEYKSNDVISSALCILYNIVQCNSKQQLVEQEFIHDLDSLEVLLSETYPPIIHQNTLMLINELFNKGKKLLKTITSHEKKKPIV